MSSDAKPLPVIRPLPGAEAFPAVVQDAIVEALGQELPEGAAVPRFANRLLLEASPYLRQHAHNPVNWYPWGDEAFAMAARLGRPVFLSIGYATCHWCHVMETESFDDEGIAAYLNEHYVAIKVDREERPDVDAVYMSAVQQLTGGGGWPMSVWLNEAREPFFGGTYFPPRKGARGARRGFLELLSELRQLHLNDAARVKEAAASLSEAIRADLATPTLGPVADGWRPDARLLAATAEVFARSFDEDHGGLQRVPKFPSNVPVRLLLRHHQRSGDPQPLRIAVTTLAKMAAGGLYDQLAGGFHRYSTDREWLVPHFEKMLYDNALLVVAYTEAWQVTHRRDFARVVRETCDELLATFAAPEGGFYAATDADSGEPREEGLFFVWTPAEVRQVLGDGPTTALFLRHYGLTEEGNFEGRNILHVALPDEDVAASLSEARRLLRAAREARPKPFRDEKILASWNGLAISAFAVAGRAFGEARYVEAARRAAIFAWERLRDLETGRLYRSFKIGRDVEHGRRGAEGFLDDYAFLAAGLLELYEATGEGVWLARARELGVLTEELFGDGEAGGWFMTGPQHERLLARERPLFDGAEPAGGSVAWMNALRLAALTDESRWREVALRAAGFYASTLRERPVALTEALLAVDFALGPVREIAVLSPASASSHELVRLVDTTFLPRTVIARAVVPPATASGVDDVPAPFFLRDKTLVAGRPTVYVCHEGRCELPNTNLEALRLALEKGSEVLRSRSR